MLESTIMSDNNQGGGSIVSEFQVTVLMINTFNLARMVKFLALIDLMFAIIFAMGNVFFFIPIFMPVIGYLGALHYKKHFILSYFIFVLGMTLFRLIYYIYIYTNLDRNQQSEQTQTMTVMMISTIIELWISKIIYKFYVTMKKLPLLDLTNLRLSTNLTTPRLIFW